MCVVDLVAAFFPDEVLDGLVVVLVAPFFPDEVLHGLLSPLRSVPSRMFVRSAILMPAHPRGDNYAAGFCRRKDSEIFCW